MNSLRRQTMLGLSCLILAACGGGAGSVTERTNEVNVDGNRLTSLINKGGRYYLNVNGSRNDVEVASGNYLYRISINGSENEVTIRRDTLVDEIRIDGSGNRIYVPYNLRTRFYQNGTDNRIIER